MNQMTTPNETKKQGRIRLLVTAVCKKWLSSICTTQMGMSSYEMQAFLNYGSYDWEAAIMSQWHMYMHWDQEVS